MVHKELLSLFRTMLIIRHTEEELARCHQRGHGDREEKHRLIDRHLPPNHHGNHQEQPDEQIEDHHVETTD